MHRDRLCLDRWSESRWIGIEALELLAMTLAHLHDAESRGEVSPRVPLLMVIRDKLAIALREES